MPTPQTLRRAAKSRTALGACVLACLGLAATTSELSHASPGAPMVASAVLGDGSVGVQRSPGTFGGALADAQAAGAGIVLDPATGEPTQVESAPPPPPTPVAGLNQTQMDNAWKIVQAGQGMGLPARAFVIAVATAMQESNLYNLASSRVPSSYNYPHEGSGSDHDSVGLFQQRASSGWGRVAQLMDPTYAATAFYSALQKVPGWQSMALTWAAQRVQRSAYPYAYAKHESRAQAVVDALVGTSP